MAKLASAFLLVVLLSFYFPKIENALIKSESLKDKKNELIGHVGYTVEALGHAGENAAEAFKNLDTVQKGSLKTLGKLTEIVLDSVKPSNIRQTLSSVQQVSLRTLRKITDIIIPKRLATVVSGNVTRQAQG